MRVLAIAFLVLCGCAGLSEQELYDRENTLIIAQENYQLQRQACLNAGGVMTITGNGNKFRMQHTGHDYNFAQCVHW